MKKQEKTDKEEQKEKQEKRKTRFVWKPGDVKIKRLSKRD